ncbi:hypothetical protein [Pedobacter psychroterrae]|uniref:Uncharacterized protein n=1 Tax=Pedobacter psychroterrae TaxID=2530453 RepID=A0A4R0NCS2_9SPHI|nr:hypothetical protein [Pedobacter psychroterrae]TCC98045.1 hypothetical protein EZ437_19565 [Pedobacter psychroterrae]
MAELLPINIDLTIASKYTKLTNETPSFLDKTAALFVPEQYHERLIQSLKQLLTDYKLDHKHLDYFLYIIGQQYLLYEVIDEQKIDALECFQPLRFLQSYIIQTEDIKRTSKTEAALNKKLNSRYIEVVSPAIKSATPIKLSNTDFVVKAIYKLFKEQYDHSLKELLREYDTLPPLKVINELVKENDYIVNYATRYFIPQMVLDLLDYINDNVDGKLSRKQYTFIFDLIFLWGVFVLVEEEDTEYFEVTTEFKPLTIASTEKTDYLKKVIHRYKKYLKTHA